MGSMMFCDHVLNSEHAHMPIGSKQMPIGWNEVSMPINVCSVCMPIGSVNLRSGVLSRDSVPFMMEIVLTCIPIKSGIVYPNVNRLLYSPG